MKLKGKIASTLLIIDTFFVSFAFGFNSRHVLIVDQTLPAYVPKVELPAEKPKTELKKDKADSGKSTGSESKATSKETVKADAKKHGSQTKSKHATHSAAPSPNKSQ